MRIASGKVITGKVVVEGEPFEDGAEVVVIAAEDLDTFELEPDDQIALLDRIAEADQGRFVDGDEVLAKIRRRR